MQNRALALTRREIKGTELARQLPVLWFISYMELDWKSDFDASGGQSAVLKTTTPARKPPVTRQSKIAPCRSLSPQITDNKLLTKITVHASAFGIGHAFFPIE
jgi:hypothetical protein